MHLADFMAAFNFARRLETIASQGPRTDGGPRLTLTPYKYICTIWISEADGYIVNPIHRMPKLNSWVEKVTVVHARILPRNWLLDHATLVAFIAGRSQALQVLHHWRQIQAPPGRRSICCGRAPLRRTIHPGAFLASWHGLMLSSFHHRLR